MTQYHSGKKAQTTDEIEEKLNAITATEIAAFTERLETFKKEQEEAKAKARKAKASAFGHRVGIGIIKSAVIATKVAKTAWCGSFELVKTSITLVEQAPSTIASAVTAQYKKA